MANNEMAMLSPTLSPVPVPPPPPQSIGQHVRGGGGGGGGGAGDVLDEPEAKKVKLAHYQYLNLIENLKQTNSMMNGGGNNNNLTAALSYTNSSIFMVHKKLEERIGGILCCTVCLGWSSFFFCFNIECSLYPVEHRIW